MATLPAEMSGGGEAESFAEPTDADLAALVEETEGSEPPVEAASDETTEAKPEGEKPPEVKAEDKPPAEETPDAAKLRKGFAALARDRKKMHDREQAAEAAIASAKQHETKAQHFDNVVKRLHEDPHALLLEAGGEALVNKFLEQCGSAVKSPAEQEIAKLRAEREQEREAAKQAESQRQVAEWQRNIVAEVEKAGETFDLVNSLGHHDAVIETIIQYHQKYNGAVLPVEVAARAVEERLAAGLGKSKKFGPREAVKPPVTPAPPAPQKKGAMTLTSVGAGEPSHVANGTTPLDDEARFSQTLRELEQEGLL